jgi:lysophospholipase L1-like esterase
MGSRSKLPDKYSNPARSGKPPQIQPHGYPRKGTSRWGDNSMSAAQHTLVRSIRPLQTLTLCAVLLSLSGCGLFGSGGNSGGGTGTATGPFTNVVFVGDSLTAGFQNGSLLDTQQPNGFASLIATQANFAITLPLIASPGLPAVLRLVSVGPPPVTASASGVSTGRENGTAQPTDLAVPGHKLHDLLYYTPPAVPTSAEDIITQAVLGFPVGNGKAQADEAVALKPSTIFLWAGNNDALIADDTGMPSSMTPLASFTTDFTQLVAKLKATGANLIIANIPDVTAIPYLTPAQTLASQLSTSAGVSAASIQSGLGLANGDLVDAQGLSDAETQVKGLSTGGKLTALPDADVLTAAEVATVQNTINGYNQVIQQLGSAAGATLVDTHAYFATLAAGVSINGVVANNTFLGGLFGLDGIHPTNTGYALLANQFITALNTKFALSIPAVNVGTIASTDPYFGANIKPTGKDRIPTDAALQTQQIMQDWYQHPR